MRILIVDHYYGAVVDWMYSREPSLDRESYATQRARIDTFLFGQTSFEVAALRDLGHEASDSLVNIRPLQEAWAREHDQRLSPATRWRLRRRRRLVPWLAQRSDDRWMAEALLAQVRQDKPDAVHIQSMDVLRPEIITAVRRETRLVVGQIAADLPAWDCGGYDLIVSSVPDLVQQFRRDGATAEWLPLAFEPSLVEQFQKVPRDLAVSFVGSFSVSHPKRIQVLEAVARVGDLRTWTGDAGVLPAGSPIRSTVQGVAWGRDMYEVLRRSRLTINNHARIAGTAANNLRLFEGTGMGALLITDAATNLGDLFEAGREVATYRTAQECGEVVRHYLDHPHEAAGIAAAGQRRTLRDHTWRDRMERLVDMIRLRI